MEFQEEAQICRLCGQYESIYIDVFGEEGTKRFLGLKIHTRINILIDERDPLPKAICVQCLGKLEFVCDFQEECLRTQQVLRDRYNLQPLTDIIKENDGLPQQVCVRCVGTVEFLCDFYERCHHIEKGFLETHNQVKEIEYNEGIDAESDKENERPPIALSVENEQNKSNILKIEKDVEVKSENTKSTVRTTRSKSLNNMTNVTRKSKNGLDVDITSSENSLSRRRNSRRLSLKQAKDSDQSTDHVIVKKETQKDVIDKKPENPLNRTKRQCLRTICTNNKSDSMDTATICKSQKEQQHFAIKEKVPLENISNEVCTATNENDATALKKLEKENMNKLTESMEDNLPKSKPVSVIVNQKEAQNEGMLLPIVWIPSNMLIREAEKPKLQEEKGLPHPSPPPGDEAEKGKHCENDPTIVPNIMDQSSSSDRAMEIDPRPLMFTEQDRVTVIIESSRNDEIVVQDVLEDDCANVTNQSTWDTSQTDSADHSQGSSHDGSFSGDKSKIGTFGKISELISEEQKETIEKYYKVDMSIVNSALVKKNLTVMDKRKVRCDICGRMYLRMDKCQVHIWGHLKMKPYQCKACDFSTVTVSNVRCHIRKSHLKIKPFACHLCEKRYVTAVLLEEHLNTHTGARPFKCKICDFATGSRQMLSYHNTTHKPVKDINCKVCGKEFYSRGRLRSHMFVHNKDRVVKCELCSTYLSSAEALKTHHMNIHTRDYVCNICGKHVKSRKALHNHVNVHAAARYKCSLCPNVYKSSQILKEHILKHKGIRKYKCNVCEKTFAQQSHLGAHMAVHSNIRFHCPGCDRAFNRHDNMKIHTKRCKLFLGNPSLKNVVIKKEISTVEEPNKPVGNTNTNACDSVPCSSAQIENVTLKTVIDTQKTDTNQDDTFIPEDDGVTVLHNVLKPENF